MDRATQFIDGDKKQPAFFQSKRLQLWGNNYELRKACGIASLNAERAGGSIIYELF
jgi:hypothetical protein